MRGKDPRSGRPPAVEEVLAALDKDDPQALAKAIESAGPPDGYAPPWRDELRLALLVLARDHDALWAFATMGERGPARARALVWLVQKGRDQSERERAKGRMLADYPDSWASSLLKKGEK